MLILMVYADDSADARQETVFTVGGFMGYPHMFEKAEIKWDAYLRSQNLSYFKASEAESLYGEFDPLKLMMTPRAARAFAESVRYDLGQIFVQEKIGGISLSLDIKDFRKVISEQKDFSSYFETEDYCVYMFKHFIIHCVGLMIRDMPEFHPELAFIFDDHSKWKEAEESYRLLKNNSRFSARIVSVTHADDKKTPALQMADICAYEGRCHTLNIMRGCNQRVEFETMVKYHSIYSFSMFREEQLLQHLEAARNEAIDAIKY
jgi:hypothetical protein